MLKNNGKPPIEILLKPFNSFIKAEASGGILLLICTVIAMVWANLPISESYFHLWHTKLSFSFSGFELDYSLHHWINDGLMAIFFFVVGLEIKRELLVGELSTAKKASLPVAAALGGMLFPAAIYFILNSGGAGESGWGIPMATDIAFAIGILALLGKNVPITLKVFVTALAIADDIGAVLVIAFFYTSQISYSSLGIAGIFFVLLVIANLLGVRNLLVYVVLGIGLWLAFLFSGIHATVAGVLLAFTIPASSRINTLQFSKRSKNLLDEFDNAGEEGPNVLTNEDRQSAVQELEENCEKIMTPLQRFEHKLTPWVSFFIMPVFALANAGVSLGGEIGAALTSSVSLGIILGLFVGKQIGIFFFTWLSIKLKISEKPESIKWIQIYGAGILAGIGFTMSLFITNLAFTDEHLINLAKVGILTASLISGIIGFIILKKNGKSVIAETAV